MTDNSEDIILKFQNLKQLIKNESKRVLKANVPKSKEIRNEVRDNFLNHYNNFVKLVSSVYRSLNENQYYTIKKIFSYARDKVIRSFQVLKVPYKVPTSCTEPINTEIIDEDLVFSEEEERQEVNPKTSDFKLSDKSQEQKVLKMAMTKIEFFNFASKVVSQEFDGSTDRLQSFLDSLNLLQANSEGNEQNAVAYVRTKLTGRARDLIAEGDSLDEISVKLRRGIITESSHLVSAKLLSLKQHCKESSKYATEIEELASKLKRAYINEGVPVDVAETYSTNTVVKALKTNTNSDKSKLIMEAGTFKTCQEAITKFVNISNDPSTSTVLLASQNRPRRGGYRGRNFHYEGNYNRHVGRSNQPFSPQVSRGYNGNRRSRFNKDSRREAEGRLLERTNVSKSRETNRTPNRVHWGKCEYF